MHPASPGMAIGSSQGKEAETMPEAIFSFALNAVTTQTCKYMHLYLLCNNNGDN